MAHKTLIDGTAYEISGGKTLIDGTAYSIKNGKTLVDGTAYEVGFGKFVLVYDFGLYTPNNSVTSSITGETVYYTITSLSEFPSGYDKLNTLIVDGVEYEIIGGIVTNGARYQYANGDTAVSFMKIFSASVSITLYDNNTHSVQIGYYE